MIKKKDDIENYLRKGQEVRFELEGKVYDYKVADNHLRFDEGDNNTIFRALGLDDYAFCEKAYGYPPYRGTDWPACHPGDFSALTRVVKALYDEIENREFSARKILIRFMELKQEALPGYDYFNSMDRMDMESWSEETCREILEKIEKHKSDLGMRSHCCPFCWKNAKYSGLDCKNCTYGERHKICGMDDSDWKKLPFTEKVEFDWYPLLKRAKKETSSQEWLKVWEDKSEDDPTDQLYLMLVQDHSMIGLKVVNKKGLFKKWILSMAEREGIYLYQKADIGMYPVDSEGKIKVENL